MNNFVKSLEEIKDILVHNNPNAETTINRYFYDYSKEEIFKGAKENEFDLAFRKQLFEGVVNWLVIGKDFSELPYFGIFMYFSQRYNVPLLIYKKTLSFSQLDGHIQKSSHPEIWDRNYYSDDLYKLKLKLIFVDNKPELIKIQFFTELDFDKSELMEIQIAKEKNEYEIDFPLTQTPITKITYEINKGIVCRFTALVFTNV